MYLWPWRPLFFELCPNCHFWLCQGDIIFWTSQFNSEYFIPQITCNITYRILLLKGLWLVSVPFFNLFPWEADFFHNSSSAMIWVSKILASHFLCKCVFLWCKRVIYRSGKLALQFYSAFIELFLTEEDVHGECICRDHMENIETLYLSSLFFIFTLFQTHI